MEHKQSFNHFLHKIKVHSRYFSTKECTIDFLSYVTKLIFNHFLRKPIKNVIIIVKETKYDAPQGVSKSGI